jgi:hypothetical protein
VLIQTQLETILSIHSKAYALLKWLNNQLQRSQELFSHQHGAFESNQAAEEWIIRNWNNLPSEALPERDQIKAFANYFASFLTTSFEFLERDVVPDARTMCDCMFCQFMIHSRFLKTKKITKQVKATAQDLMIHCLMKIADQQALRPTQTDMVQFMLDKPDLAFDIALITYVYELIRRMEYSSQGPAVLYLWRQIAWDDNQPKKKFNLNPELVFASQNKLIEALRKTFLS